jgi:hypothetical protein
MSDAPDNLILAYLRKMDEKLDRLTTGVAELARRVTSRRRKSSCCMATSLVNPNASIVSNCGWSG